MFDLSGIAAPRIRYWRHWANASNVNVALQVDISNDGGASWTNVENISGSQHAQWTAVSFAVEDYVAATATMRLRFVTALEYSTND